MRTSQIAIVGLGLVAALTGACNSKENTEQATVTSDHVNIEATAAEPTKGAENAPAMKFTEEVHDFGKIVDGEKVSYSFEFVNTGGADLVISSAKGSCGCTVPDYPKNPVAPGAKAKIDVVFDSSGKMGKVEKTITILSNATPSTAVLIIRGEVLENEKK